MDHYNNPRNIAGGKKNLLLFMAAGGFWELKSTCFKVSKVEKHWPRCNEEV